MKREHSAAIFRAMLGACLMAFSLAAQQLPCYEPGKIPPDPIGVATPRDLSNGMIAPGIRGKLDLTDKKKLAEFNAMSAWMQKAVSTSPFCFEFSTPRTFDPILRGEQPTATEITVRHRFQQSHVMERRLTAAVMWNTPHVSRIEIAYSFAGRRDIPGKYYPGYDLLYPSGPSPVGAEWRDHPHWRSGGQVFYTSADGFQPGKFRQGAVHRQLDADGDIVSYRLNRRRVGGWGFFAWIPDPIQRALGSGEDEWYWQWSGHSDQDFQLGDVLESLPSLVKQPVLRTKPVIQNFNRQQRPGKDLP